MNKHAHPVALPRSGPRAATPGVGQGAAPDLPEWARTLEARRLLRAIVLERPEVRYFDNGESQWGGKEYKGRNAADLRRLFSPYESRLIAECQWSAPDYEARREAIIAFIDRDGPDALIERLLAKDGTAFLCEGGC